MSEIQISGQTIYELDSSGVNRWSANIQPGINLAGFRQPDSVIDRVAKRLYTADLYHEKLVEALRKIETMQAKNKGNATETHIELDDLCVDVRALLAELLDT